MGERVDGGQDGFERTRRQVGVKFTATEQALARDQCLALYTARPDLLVGLIGPKPGRLNKLFFRCTGGGEPEKGVDDPAGQIWGTIRGHKPGKTFRPPHRQHPTHDSITEYCAAGTEFGDLGQTTGLVRRLARIGPQPIFRGPGSGGFPAFEGPQIDELGDHVTLSGLHTPNRHRDLIELTPRPSGHVLVSRVSRRTGHMNNCTNEV